MPWPVINQQPVGLTRKPQAIRIRRAIGVFHHSDDHSWESRRLLTVIGE
jgi:hypothetical protein